MGIRGFIHYQGPQGASPPTYVVGSSYSRFAARLLKPKPQFHHLAQGTTPARLPLVGEGPWEGARRDVYGAQGLLGSHLGLG